MPTPRICTIALRLFPLLIALLTLQACVSHRTESPRPATAAAQSLAGDNHKQDDFPLVAANRAAAIFIDKSDAPAVRRAAGDLASDIAKVTGQTPAVQTESRPAGDVVVIAGTLGHSSLIDDLVKSGKLDVQAISGKWESFLVTTIANPMPGVASALVIVGSDRRGTIYGMYDISSQIGVSPWYWWADVPVKHRDSIFIPQGTRVQGPPGVKYRGIFINDEDWGLNAWAKNTFDPEFNNIGPKTYEKVFELLLRLRLNYLWPAMHACSREFASDPRNAALADEYGIVIGSSHCEPMLCNNIHWNQKTQGNWNYSTNRDAIYSYWKQSAASRGQYEAVWTLGIRGIHDAGMQKPPDDMPGKIKLLGEVFHDQRELLDQHVAKTWGPVAQAFVPYKEVLPIFDAGLAVPEDVTLVWVDDNFGYIRRLGAPAERKRSGGAGVYWHLSYYGSPHSYTWINSTAPALMWEELGKAWDNDARNLWVINVGDIKPGEIGIDYFSKFSWNPPAFGADSQPVFLRQWAAANFGENSADAIADLLSRYYRLGTIHKPELMNRAWAMSLDARQAEELRAAYGQLLADEKKLAAAISRESQDAFFEMVGFPARVIAISGQIFLADRAVQRGEKNSENQAAITTLRDELESQVTAYNTVIAGGKWKDMMSGLVTARDMTKWNSQVRWPWGEKPPTTATTIATTRPAQLPRVTGTWRDATTADRRTSHGSAQWVDVVGLGISGKAVALKPAGLESAWQGNDMSAPSLEFAFEARDGSLQVAIDFLPTFRLCPGMQLRVAVRVDDQPSQIVEVPGSSGQEDERGQVRANGVQDNFIRAIVPLAGLSPGKHNLKISAIDPGIVIDRVALPR